MALFSKTKKTAAVPKKPAKVKKEVTVVSTTAGAGSRDLSYVLERARITEKASMHQQDSVYVFNVSDRASKRDIIAAVRKFFNVTPRKVSIAAVPSKIKRNARTGRVGVKTGGKKAYVYLKKGETINL